MAKEKWYSDSYRRNLVDMHIEDWSDEFLSAFDPNVYFENLKLAQIRSAMIYIQSHVGYCYWPAKEGHMHKAFVGREHAMRDLFDLCHGAGIDVIAYYSLIYNNWAYEHHPEWRMHSFDGKDSRDGGGRYGLCCPNNPDYRSFVLRQIEDFCGYFDFEGVFFDMTFWPMVCACDSCRKRFADEAGGELPATVDWSDPRWRFFQQKREEWLGEFASLTTEKVRALKPGCTVEHQNSTDMSYWRFGVNRPIIEASDYVGGDLYGGVEQQSFACKLYHSLTLHPPFEYMTSRCYPSLREHTGTKTRDRLRQSVRMTYAHHGAPLLIDAIDPRGTIDRRLYETMGDVFSFARGFEPFLKGEPVADVGIFFSLSGKMDPAAAPAKIGSGVENNEAVPQLEAALGAARTLRARHIPFDVICGGRLDLLEGLKVLILPDVPFMSEEETAAVRAFVAGGGSLYFSRFSATALLPELFGPRFDALTDESVTYLAPAGDSWKEGGLLAGYTPDYPMTLFARQAKLEGPVREGAEVLATTTLPYTRHMAGDFMQAGRAGDNAEYSRFAAIHSDPPGRRTAMPALLRARYGKGRAIWSAAPFEAADRPMHREVFARIIDDLSGKAYSLRTDAPDEIETVAFRVPESGRVLVSCVDTRARFTLGETRGVTLRIRSDKAPSGALLLPEERTLPFSYEEGEAVVNTGSFRIFQMIAVDF